MSRCQTKQVIRTLLKGADDDNLRLQTSERMGVGQIDPCRRRNRDARIGGSICVRIGISDTGSNAILRRPSFRETSRWFAKRPSQKQQRTLTNILKERSCL